VNEKDLDLAFHYGDYIYEYREGDKASIHSASGELRKHVGDEIHTVSDYRRRYAQYKSDPMLQRAHESMAFISSFDDHEVDNNWASDFDQDETDPQAFALRRMAAMQAWYENMPVRKALAPVGGKLTMYRSFDFGQLIRMHTLDTRSYRTHLQCRGKYAAPECTPQFVENDSVLGDAQEQWLANNLSQDSHWNLLAQQIMVAPLVGFTQEDTWNGYPASRQRLADTITERKLDNVVIVAGDIHCNVVGTLPKHHSALDGPAAATEFVATSISSSGDGSPDAGDVHEKLMSDNPHIDMFNRQRGYHIHDITPERWQADVRMVDMVTKPGGSIQTLASYAVTPDKAGLHKA
jgi:alkaline phosphatase D